MDITDQIIKIAHDIGMSGKVVANAMEIPYGTFIKRRYRTQRFTSKNLEDLKKYLRNKVDQIDGGNSISFAKWINDKYWQDEESNVYYKSMREYREVKTYTIEQLFEIYARKNSRNR